MPASKDEAWAFTRRAQDLQAGEKQSFTTAPPRRETTPTGAAAIGSDRGQIRVHTRSTRIRRRLAGPTVRPARQPILPSPPCASRHRHQAAPPPSTTTKRSLRHHHQPIHRQAPLRLHHGQRRTPEERHRTSSSKMAHTAANAAPCRRSHKAADHHHRPGREHAEQTSIARTPRGRRLDPHTTPAKQRAAYRP